MISASDLKKAIKKIKTSEGTRRGYGHAIAFVERTYPDGQDFSTMTRKKLEARLNKTGVTPHTAVQYANAVWNAIRAHNGEAVITRRVNRMKGTKITKKATASVNGTRMIATDNGSAKIMVEVNGKPDSVQIDTVLEFLSKL